jgi:hypothetical protein
MSTVGQEVLARLVAKFGGPDQAAARLGITDTLMGHLLSGALAVPDSILLKAVDVFLDDMPTQPPRSQPTKVPRPV